MSLVQNIADYYLYFFLSRKNGQMKLHFTTVGFKSFQQINQSNNFIILTFSSSGSKQHRPGRGHSIQYVSLHGYLQWNSKILILFLWYVRPISTDSNSLIGLFDTSFKQQQNPEAEIICDTLLTLKILEPSPKPSITRPTMNNSTSNPNKICVPIQELHRTYISIGEMESIVKRKQILKGAGASSAPSSKQKKGLLDSFCFDHWKHERKRNVLPGRW